MKHYIVTIVIKCSCFIQSSWAMIKNGLVCNFLSQHFVCRSVSVHTTSTTLLCNISDVQVWLWLCCILLPLLFFLMYKYDFGCVAYNSSFSLFWCKSMYGNWVLNTYSLHYNFTPFYRPNWSWTGTLFLMCKYKNVDWVLLSKFDKRSAYLLSKL